MEFMLKTLYLILSQKREEHICVETFIFSHPPIWFTTELVNMNLKLIFNEAIK